MDQQGKTILWEILSVALSLFFISLTHFLSLPPSLLIYFSLWISLSLPIYLSLSVSIIISPSPPVSAHSLTLGQTVLSRSYALTIHKTNSINFVIEDIQFGEQYMNLTTISGKTPLILTSEDFQYLLILS